MISDDLLPPDLAADGATRSWNYRVMEFLSGTDEAYRELREVHYDAGGRPIAYSDSPAIVGWYVEEGEEAPFRMLERMKGALAKPVLSEDDFPDEVRIAGEEEVG